MMKAREVHYNHETGVVTIHQPGDRRTTVSENCTGIDLVAGDDVSVRVDGQMAHLEALFEEPLLIREKKDSREVAILTPKRPDQEPDRLDERSTQPSPADPKR